MSDSAFEQRTIFEVVGENRFEEVKVRNRFGIFQSTADYNKRRKLVEKSDALPALEMATELRFRYRRLRGRSGFVPGLVPAGLVDVFVAGVAAAFAG